MLPSAMLENPLPHLGVVRDMPLERYLSSPGLSKSGLDDFADCPFKYWARHLDPNREREEREVDEGTLTHCAILEPSEFNERYVVGPDVSRNSKEWREFCKQWAGHKVIKPEQARGAMARADAVRRHRDVAKLLSLGSPEQSAFWSDPSTQLLCRCRPDWVHPVGHRGVILGDVKTYSNANLREFKRQVERKRYHWQAAFYTDGYSIAADTPVLGFVFIAVELKPPYCVSACMLDEESLNIGRQEIAEMMKAFALCQASNTWPAYGDNVQQIELPHWYNPRTAPDLGGDDE